MNNYNIIALLMMYVEKMEMIQSMVEKLSNIKDDTSIKDKDILSGAFFKLINIEITFTRLSMSNNINNILDEIKHEELKEDN